MSTMTRWKGAGALLALLLVAGSGPVARAQPERSGCMTDAREALARIEIRYGAYGGLQAVPDACRVRPGTRVEWFSTGKADGARKAVSTFRVEFREGSPDAERRGSFKAEQAGADGYVAAIAKARPHEDGGEAANTYKYWVVVGAEELDPSIIIDP
jgi:hypothetical protein